MKKKAIVISLLFMSSLLFPLTLTINYKTSAYPTILHPNLIYASLTLLLNDSENTTSPFYLCLQEIMTPYNNYLDQICKAQSDYDSGYIYQWDHYWNPHKLKGLYGNRGAPYHAQDYFEKAINYYLGLDSFPVDKRLAYYYLGFAIHLVQDLTIPHHARNDPFNQHAEYELFCCSSYYDNNIPLPESGSYTPPKDWTGLRNARAWVHKAALLAYPYYDIITTSQNDDVWLNISRYLVGEAIKLTTGFLFYFWQYVHDIDFDSDGLPATIEQIYNCDYTNNDTDNDLISDYDEIYVYNTNPDSWDTDSDGYSDYDEIFIYFTDPTDKYDTPYYSIPLPCKTFVGLSDAGNSLTFYWNLPKNYRQGWYFKVFRIKDKEEELLYNDSGRSFSFLLQNATEFITYRLYCYKSEFVKSIYLQWSGCINSKNVSKGVPQ